jgi:anti-anti-sigma regulatory factor/CHASE3 domain sensor protein
VLRPPVRVRGPVASRRVSRQSLTGRFVAVGVLLGAMLVVLFVVLQVAVGQLRAALRDSGRSDRVIAGAIATQRIASDLETGLRGYLLTGDEAFLDPTRAAQRQIAPEGRELARLVAGNRGQAARAARLQHRLEAYASGYVEQEIAAGADRPRAALTASAREGRRQLDEIRNDVDGLVAAERSIDNRRQRDADATTRRNTIIRAGGFALLLLLVPLALWYLVRVVLRPVREVSGAATRLAGGDPSARAPARGAGEVAVLARSFNAMADALEVSREELERRGIRLAETNDQLRAAYRELERSKQQAILELSTPVLQLSTQVLVLPIIGALDHERARQIDDRLLAEARARRARVVVVDVTGVPEIDSRVARQLLATVAALRLLGTRVIMTGISGELAQALVGLDVDFHGVDSFADLQGGVEAARG